MTPHLSSSSGLEGQAATGWSFRSRGVLRRSFEASDASGAAVGEAHFGLRRRGTLRWRDRTLELRGHGVLRESYELREGGTAIATIEDRGWLTDRRNMSVAGAASDPGLMMFVTYVIEALAASRTTSGSSANSSWSTFGGGPIS